MTYNSKYFGDIIGKLRTQRKLSQQSMANRAGIARSHLVALESGKKCPRLDTVWKIAEAFNIKPSDLISCAETEMDEAAKFEQKVASDFK